MTSSVYYTEEYQTALALIGMSGRFPGAQNVTEFWQNISQGHQSLRPLSDEELRAAGVDPALLRDPNFVRVGAIVEQADTFDAAFFGYSPREAEIMDPQHRLFLECCWEALEDAACDVSTYQGLIGVFAGSAVSTYMLRNLLPNKELMDLIGQMQLDVGNDRDSLSSTVAYKLGLRGPALAVQTFCSTSLVATHLACQSLLNYESDIALAGGVSIVFPQETGYLYEEGGILSPDGVCRTFDARGQGSVMGNGVGVVALKRLHDALDDGDHIYAIIRGSAINNDGSTRVSYTAPGVDGEANVISAALSYANLSAESISYMEAHGTATVLGDAVEIAAMQKAFNRQTNKKRFCAIGSVKPNVGHLDRAAGITGLIKTSLALHHRQIPPSLHFERTSPDVDLDNSPFYVNTTLKQWESTDHPRRAGVSSFGLGGTNAHVVLEQAPEVVSSPHSRPWSLLLLSAKTETALDAMCRNLASFLETHPDLNIADVAYTLQVGRSTFNYQQALLCTDSMDALQVLRDRPSDRLLRQHQVHRNRPVAFLIPEKAHYPFASLQVLYQEEHAFRVEVERCCRCVQEQSGLALQALFEGHEQQLSASGQAALHFIVEYGLARLLQQGGIQPACIYGSEPVAACLSGVLSLEDALRLVVQRARSLETGASVLSSEQAAKMIQGISLQKPTIPYASHLTTTWITAEQATSPRYWQTLLCLEEHTPREWKQLLSDSECLFLEVGPGQMLEALRPGGELNEELRFSILPADPEQSSQRHLLITLGRLWLAGISINWQGFYAQEQRCRLSLPTYPFERKRYWLAAPGAPADSPENLRKPEISDWFSLPTWEPAPLAAQQAKKATYLLFLDENKVSETLARTLEQAHHTVIRVYAGNSFEQLQPHRFQINPRQPEDYIHLFRTLTELQCMPDSILHAWSLTEKQRDGSSPEQEHFQTVQHRGFYSLLFLVQALNSLFYEKELHLLVLSNALHLVREKDHIEPEKATLLGACIVIGQEYPHIICRCIDLDLADKQINAFLATECQTRPTERVVAYRNGQRYTRTYRAKQLSAPTGNSLFRTRGTYLITGGLGRIGLLLAEHLARTVQARLILVGRTELPAHDTWADWLKTHDAQDTLSQKIRRLQEIEAYSSTVQYYAADVADEQQMQRVVQQATALYGPLHGIFHTAGITPDTAFSEIQTTGIPQAEEVFRSKVQGLYVLERVLKDQPLDFCLLFSSIAAILGGLGFVTYAAANNFVNAFTEQHNQHAATRWISVNWDTWRVEEREQHAIGSTVAAYAMTPTEAIQALEYTLTCQDSVLINSTGDIHTRIRQWVEMDGFHRREASAPEAVAVVTSAGEYERQLVAIWQQILGLDEIGLDDNFFELGGNSLIALQLIARIKKTFRVQISVVTLFEAPTINTMLKYLQASAEPRGENKQDILKSRRQQARATTKQQDIAIIGMAGRFPGASTVTQFWHNLCHGIESITFFSEEELLEAGVDPEQLKHPAYVKARPILEDIELFDAAFFGYSPREAELLDPQHRLFLECAWQALENAGYDPQRYKGLIGMFGGSNVSTYLYCALANIPHIIEEVGGYQIAMNTDKDSLTTSVSYKLNLKGPSVSVQTFCSTSLVAAHMACQSLAQGECDIALAGGVSIRVPSKEGYIYEAGGMESPDGHCRTFDAKAKGSMFGDGAGIVVLKRLEEALADGDTIYAVIKGSAMNNDGSLKVSYTAPSVIGQSEVIMAALERAGVSADSISYVEAHGTATELGDPIEVAALTKAFQSHTRRTNYCAIGSVKTNVGHLDRAAGVSGLIKTALALQHRVIPPSLHFESPNPQIDFVHSPFYVNTTLCDWQTDKLPRRAGLNSLGMGGTNVHMVLEEPPSLPERPASTEPQLLLLSARNAQALEHVNDNLLAYLQEQGDTLDLADVAYTLQVGRKVFEHRRMFVFTDRSELVTALEQKQANKVFSHAEKRTERPVVFLFPGVGEQYRGLARDLYEHEPVFREVVEQCARILEPILATDIRAFFVNPEGHSTASRPALAGRAPVRTPDPLAKTEVAQPFTFVVEYALARLLMHLGITPAAMLGYSVGEYVAACLAEVLSLQDTLTLVARRAQWIAQQPEGAMLTVMLSAEEVQPYLEAGLDLAVVNGPHVCVLSGTIPAIERLEKVLQREGIAGRRIDATHAFHSRQLWQVQETLTALASTMQHKPAKIPYLSNVTGTWITAEQTADPTYWARHMCGTVQFAAGLEQLLQEPDWALLEVGAGQTLGSFLKQHPACSPAQRTLILSTLPSRHEQQSAQIAFLSALGKLWLTGVSIDWEQLSTRPRRRVPLPTYPFERKRYWCLPPKATLSGRNAPIQDKDPLRKQPDITDWFYLPTWKQALPGIAGKQSTDTSARWLLFLDSCGIGKHLSDQLQAAHQEVITVSPGSTFDRESPNAFRLVPENPEHYKALFRALGQQNKLPRHIVYLWSVSPDSRGEATASSSDFYRVLSLVQAVGDQGLESGNFFMVSNGIHSVTGNERLFPEKSLIMGFCRVLPQEYPQYACCNIDIDLTERAPERLAHMLMNELQTGITEGVVALRGSRRWVQSFEPVQLPSCGANEAGLRQKGVYLITGGLGGIALGIATYLARTVQARLILVGRSELPPRREWEQILSNEDPNSRLCDRIRQILHLEELGAEVLIQRADVTDEAAMQEVISKTLARFGTLHGVLHTAGLPGVGLMQLKKPEVAASVLAPKVQGTLVLERVLHAIPLDFLVLFSSMNSTTGGGPGQVDYCAANTFLDVYAQARMAEGKRVIAIDWGEWQWNAWAAGLDGYDPAVQEFFIENRRRIGISFEEGAEALTRVLAQRFPHIVVSTQQFHALIEASKDFTSATVLQQARGNQARYERPTLGVEYLAPASELEAGIADIWSELLGIESIGVNDNFFELGGHSLLATQLISRLRRHYQIELPLATIFEAPTIADQAVVIELAMIDEIESLDAQNLESTIS